jgi:hypothetical protein
MGATYAGTKWGLGAIVGKSTAGAVSLWGGFAVAVYFFSRGVYWNNNENTLGKIKGSI